MNVTQEVVEPYARPHVEEIADFMPLILTQFDDRTVELPRHRSQNAQFLCPKRWTLQEIVHEDDHEV